MERAALETVRVLKDRGVDFSDTLVVCGSGNNGGDGFADARILKEYGFCAEVLFVGQDASMSEECRTQKQIAERLGISVFTDFPKKEYTVIIDAVFGVGLSRAIEGRYHTVIEWMNDKKCEKQRSTFHPAYVRRAAEFWELHFVQILQFLWSV